jgi:hypothetical protein
MENINRKGKKKEEEARQHHLNHGAYQLTKFLQHGPQPKPIYSRDKTIARGPTRIVCFMSRQNPNGCSSSVLTKNP